MNYNNPMEPKVTDQPIEAENEKQNRRELVTKLGKFAAYAAPFTVMALNSKGATSSTPGRNPNPAASRH
jgi:formiminotetrahydrofolate cyclodeaminase